MRKFVFSFLLLSIVILIGISVNAEEKSSDYDEEEIQLMQSQMLELVEEGKEEKIGELDLVQKYKELFDNNPQLFSEYLSSLDVTNEEKVSKKLKEANEGSRDVTISSTESGVVDENIVVMDDGSFFKTTSEIIKLDKPEDVVQPLIRNYFGSYRNVHTSTFYAALYPDPVFQLNTNYELSRSGIEITSTSKSGTGSIFPYSISPASTSIVKKNATSSGSFARAKGDYTLNGIGTNGVAIVVLNYELRTQLNLDYVDAQKVVYTVRHTEYD
ncbi:hypothetical protein ACKXGF_04645 [Alkalibacillus sp. S2W]|uniref:hypothetical protein n=1 Tax=Alkalibacillus sp. S2W TaxID=3386553 RepID=UPI00398D173E